MDKNETQISKDDDFYFVKGGNQLYKVKQDEIQFLESANGYVSYVTKKRRIRSSETMNSLEEKLPLGQFVRVHKSFIIAVAHIDVLRKEWIEIGEYKIPIGRSYRTSFFRCMDEKIQ